MRHIKKNKSLKDHLVKEVSPETDNASSSVLRRGWTSEVRRNDGTRFYFSNSLLKKSYQVGKRLNLQLKNICNLIKCNVCGKQYT